MSTAVAIVGPWIPHPESNRERPDLSVRGPRSWCRGVRRYLLQLTAFLSPRSRCPDLQPATPA